MKMVTNYKKMSKTTKSERCFFTVGHPTLKGDFISKKRKICLLYNLIPLWEYGSELENCHYLRIYLTLSFTIKIVNVDSNIKGQF